MIPEDVFELVINCDNEYRDFISQRRMDHIVELMDEFVAMIQNEYSKDEIQDMALKINDLRKEYFEFVQNKPESYYLVKKLFKIYGIDHEIPKAE